MLILETFRPAFGIRCPSPPCLKTEALLALSGVEYELKYGDVTKAPRGKFPVLHDGETVIPDSANIHSHLVKHYGFDIDADLSEQERAVSHAFQQMLEKHQYFISAYLRWRDNAELVRNGLLGDVPAFIRPIIFVIVRKKVLKTSYLQGTSRHTDEELVSMVRANLTAIDSMIGDKTWFFGEKIHSIDAVMFGQLEEIFFAEIPTPTRIMAAEFPKLTDYVVRFRKEVFGE